MTDILKIVLILATGIAIVLGSVWYISTNGGVTGDHTLITTLTPAFTRAQICDRLDEAYADGRRDGLIEFIGPKTLSQYPALDVVVCMADMIEDKDK